MCRRVRPACSDRESTLLEFLALAWDRLPADRASWPSFHENSSFACWRDCCRDGWQISCFSFSRSSVHYPLSVHYPPAPSASWPHSKVTKPFALPRKLAEPSPPGPKGTPRPNFELDSRTSSKSIVSTLPHQPRTRDHTGLDKRARHRIKKSRRDEACLYGPLKAEAVPVPPEYVSVTEVSRPGRSFHPAVGRRVGAPGTPRLARSSVMTQSCRSHPDC